MIRVEKNSAKPNRREVNFDSKIETAGLPVIRCRCGAKILIVPDTAAMGKAIEFHVAHCPIRKQAKSNSKRVTDLSDFLIAQVFDITAKAEFIEKIN